MEAIKVYESFWNNDNRLAGSLTVTIWAVYMILKNQTANSGMILLGIFGLFLFSTIINYIWRKPKLIIFDKVIKVNSPEPWVVHLNDVESFYPTSYRGQEVIGVCYKQGSEYWKPEEEIVNSRKWRIRYPENLHPGKPYEIYVAGLQMTCQQLCEMLNDRLIE